MAVAAVRGEITPETLCEALGDVFMAWLSQGPGYVRTLSKDPTKAASVFRQLAAQEAQL